MFAVLVLASVLSLAVPWPAKILIDNVLGDARLPHVLHDVFASLPGRMSDRALLACAAIASLVIYVLSILLETLYLVAAVRLGRTMSYELAGDVFRHLHRLSLRFHERRPAGDTLQRATTYTFALETLVSEVAAPAIQSVILLGLMFAVMLALSPGMTLLALL